jgi:hypothetical protein
MSNKEEELTTMVSGYAQRGVDTASGYAQRGVDTASGYAQRGVDTAKELSSKTHEQASRAVHTSQGYIGQACSFSRQMGNQACETTKQYWNNFPLLRWTTYILATFVAIPLAVFLGWLIFTLGFVSTIAGTGIVVTEGFFGFCGLALFLPAAGFFTVIALIMASFVSLGWGGINILSKWGVIDKENFMEYEKQRGITARGARQSDYDYSRR